MGCSPWGRKESDTTERLHFHFSLSCTGEGNGNPLQCSCLENPRDGGAWWAAVCGVTKSLTRLKRLSSSRTLSFKDGLEIRVLLFCFLPFHTVHGVLKASILTTATAMLLQSCPILCDPIDGSLPGSLVLGILQARTLEWVAISFSNA